MAVRRNNYDVIVLAETWLRDGIFSNEIFDERYEVFRRDRDTQTSSKSDGGGVLIAVKKSGNYYVTHRPDLQSKSEDVVVTIKHKRNNKFLYVSGVYLPTEAKANDIRSYTEHVTKLRETSITDGFIIVGDFNLPSQTKENSKLILEMVSFCDLEQFNVIKNDFNGAMLDLVLSNKVVKTIRAVDPLAKVDVYHPPIIVTTAFEACSEKSQATFRNYKRVNWKQLNASLMNIHWETILGDSENIDEKVENFYSELLKHLDVHCPIITAKKRAHPSWFSKEAILLLKNKIAYHRNWKRCKNPTDGAEFSEARRKLKKQLYLDHKKFIEDTEAQLRENPKDFWKFVSAKKSNGSCNLESMHFEGKTSGNSLESANLFAEYFGSIYTSNTSSLPDEDKQNSESNPSTISFNNLFLPLHKIYETLAQLDEKKASGPDDLPPILFKRCSIALSIPLFEIYNSSLNSGTFPTRWKHAHITPIHKCGSAFDVKNFRPISKLSVPARIFDKLVTEEMSKIFLNVVIPEQHGFMKKRSTTTNLLRHTERIHQCLDKAGQLDVIYTDFSKAFDKVDHKILIEKLQRLGIKGNMLDWLASYVTGRTQQVQIGTSLSNPIPVTSSVAQGSNLGPLLFALFINDIHEMLEDVDFVLFADDLKLSKEINSPMDCAVLQRNIDKLVNFCHNNRLNLNINKCTAVSFTRRTTNYYNYAYNISGTTLERSLDFRDLGIIFDTTLSFTKHLDEIEKKCNRMMGFILRVGKDFRNAASFVCLFHSLIRSHLEYAAIIWNPHCITHKDRLERIQRKFIRNMHRRKLIPDSGDDFNYDECCRLLKFDKLETRRSISEAKFVLKSLRNQVDSSSFIDLFNFKVPQKQTRSCQPFRPNHSRTDVGKFSPMNRLMGKINSIAEHCYNNSINWDMFEDSINIKILRDALS